VNQRRRSRCATWEPKLSSIIRSTARSNSRRAASSAKTKRRPSRARLALLRIAWREDPSDLTIEQERLREGRQGEGEQAAGADFRRTDRLDESAALGDVLRIVGEEGVHPLVADAQPQWRARMAAKIVGSGIVDQSDSSGRIGARTGPRLYLALLCLLSLVACFLPLATISGTS